MIKPAFTFALLLLTLTSWGQSFSVEDGPVHQLRIYEINKENRNAFHERFRDDAHRIMKKYGFEIVSIWESEQDDRLEYVYLLEWKDEQTMKDAWDKFMADQEWKDIKKKTSAIHGTFVENIEDRTLILQDYSPSKALLDQASAANKE